MVDVYIGIVIVVYFIGNFGLYGIIFSEVINCSNVVYFVFVCEFYDLVMFNLCDWKIVQMMVLLGVKVEYIKFYLLMNEDSFYKQYGKDCVICIKLLSIVLFGGGFGIMFRGVIVCFQCSLFNKIIGVIQLMDSKIVIIEFIYKLNLDMDDQSCIENLFGFWVISYCVDNDYVVVLLVEVIDNVIMVFVMFVFVVIDVGFVGNFELFVLVFVGIVVGVVF